jgi:MFS family permease
VTDARRRSLTLLVCCLAQFMVVLDVSIVNVALPSIAADLGFTPASLAWVVNAYTLAFAGFCCSAAAPPTCSGGARCSRAGWRCSRWHRWRAGSHRES